MLDKHTASVNTPLRLVLDTNIVLDWLVFEDPAVASLRDAIHAGSVVVITSQAAIDELRRVLAYPQLEVDSVTQSKLLSEYRLRSVVESSSDDSLPAGFPRCADHDDDHFLALGLHAKADAVVSRDKAVLQLKSRAAKFGLLVADVQELMSSALIFAKSAAAK